MPRRPIRVVALDALLTLALAGSLSGLCLPWLGAVLMGEDAAGMPITPGAALWMIDLAAHWQLAFAALWVSALVLWCLRARRTRRRWLPLLAFAGLPWLSAVPALGGVGRAEGGRAEDALTLRVAAADVHVSNRDPVALVAWLRRHPVDVLVVPELSPDYAEALNAALPELPHRALYPQAGSAFGIGLYARRPLRDVVAAPDADGILALGATLELGGRPVRVVGVHPMPPVAPRWHAARDGLLHALASGDHPALGPNLRLPRLIAGNLNATPWSSALHRAARGGLRRTTGFASTWPMRRGGYLGIPIDHVLASGEWRVSSTQTGPDIGSDHAPIRVELRLVSPSP